ncbi:MAG TPA: hypothetical protein VKY42_02555 [Trueperaceae bacterium]|nr:hypothetical protein [Trueperaceae bacterium]
MRHVYAPDPGRLAVAALALGVALTLGAACAQTAALAPPATPDLDIVAASVRYDAELDLLVFAVTVEGAAGGTVPVAAGRLDGAPVLAYAFPTTLDPAAVGFGPVDGVLTLAVTAHPDFDDTPLWDEDGDGDYDDDGLVFHTHWVVLAPDDRVAGGLSVVEVADGADAVLPPTNPGMPMYMDSPGLSVVLDGATLRVLVPAWRVRGETSFAFDAVAAYLEVNTSDDARPMLGVYQVYEVLSGDLSLPFEVTAR